MLTIEEKWCIPGTVMRKGVASVDDRVAHGLVVVIDADFSTNAPSLTFRRSSLHLSEVLQIVIDAIIAMLGRDAVEPLLSHLQDH